METLDEFIRLDLPARDMGDTVKEKTMYVRRKDIVRFGCTVWKTGYALHTVELCNSNLHSVTGECYRNLVERLTGRDTEIPDGPDIEPVKPEPRW